MERTARSYGIDPAKGSPIARLDGRKAVVTGASRGIGRAIALGLAEAGASVILNYRTDRAAAQTAARSIANQGGRALVRRADVATPRGAQALYDFAADQFGVIDILVNNVGEFLLRPLRIMSSKEWRRVIDSNLTSVFTISNLFLPEMRRRGSGNIVNIGSSPCDLLRAAPNIAAYSVAKAGVLFLTRSMAAEESSFGVRVNSVSPGLIDNGSFSKKELRWMSRRIPMGKAGQPQDIANAVLFLVSDQASYISGANLAVCGGWDWGDRDTQADKVILS